jgi:signal transduction histidine kinase/ligand-binding sensor domain-containing protein
MNLPVGRGVLAGVLFLVLSTVHGLAGSNDFFARVWQTDDGLPDNNISGAAKSPDGYLWVGTLGGLMRFDGARFQEFSPAQLEGVPNKVVRSLIVDHRGRLWFAMDRGVVVCVDSNTARVFTERDNLPDTQATTMAEDSEGGIWLSYYFRPQVARIVGEQVTVFTVREGLPAGNTPVGFATDTKGRLWFVKGKNVGLFRDGHFQVVLTFPETAIRITKAGAGGIWICAGSRVLLYDEGRGLDDAGDLPADVWPTTLLEDRSGALWIGTGAHGLFRRDESGIQPMRTSHREITCLAQGREGNIWVGTAGGGLNRLRPRAVELLDTQSGLPFESVRSVCEDNGGFMWVATQNGTVARQTGSEWSILTSATNWPGGRANCIATGPAGTVWIGTGDRGLVRWQDGRFKVWRKRNGLTTDGVRSLLVSSNGDVWLPWPNRLQRLRGEELTNFELPEPTRAIRGIAEDAAGNIWLGTSEGRLYRFNGSAVVNETTLLPARAGAIRCLCATTDGSLWIGYGGSGLGWLRAGKYGQVTTAQGLHDDSISQIIHDGAGRLWLAGNHGIFQLEMQEVIGVAEGRFARVRSIVYGRSEGLPSLQANYDNYPGAIRGRDGRIWIAMRTGLALVHTEIIRDNPDPPPVFVERVAVDGQTLAIDESGLPLRPPAARQLLDLRSPREALMVRPNHRKLEIEFTALSFTAPENVHFKYRLDGYDEDWVEAGTQRYASYSRLAAGRYQFRVIACNNAGVWNEHGSTFGIIVQPFLWQTWSFRVAALAMFTLSVIAIVRYVSFRRLHRRLRLLEQQAALHNERGRIAQDIHDDLGATLTQIALLSELAREDMAEPEKAGEHVQKISVSARQVMKSLDEIVWAVNPRNDTLPHLIDYLGQFSVDFLRVPGIRCRLDLPEAPAALNLSSDVRHNLFLAVKEALNNIVKHARASEVWVRVTLAKDVLRVVVEDNGQGFERAPENAWADGLRNMRQRLTAIGGRCRIDSQTGAGTTITFEVPFERSKAR